MTLVILNPASFRQIFTLYRGGMLGVCQFSITRPYYEMSLGAYHRLLMHYLCSSEEFIFAILLKWKLSTTFEVAYMHTSTTSFVRSSFSCIQRQV